MVSAGRYTCLTSTNCAVPDNQADAEKRDLFGRTAQDRVDLKFRKAYSRLMIGGRIGRLLLVTLTTPETFQGDMHRAWRLFMWRARRRGLMREYFAVKEWNEKHTCEHLHVIFRTEDELSVALIRQCWTMAVLGASGKPQEYCGKNGGCQIWTHHKWVYDTAGMGTYLAKYLLKAMTENYACRSYWYAVDWICRGFAGFSKALWMLGKTIDVLGVKLLRAGNVGYRQYKMLSRLRLDAAKDGFYYGGFVLEQELKAIRRVIDVKEVCEVWVG